MLVRVFLALVFVSLSFNVCAAGVKKWVDADGKTHYGERPPEAVEVENVSAKVSSVGGSQGQLTNLVVLYTTSWCGYCKRAKKYLAEKGISYREYDIERDSLAKSRYQRAGGVGVPFLVRGDGTQRGFSIASYDRFFKEN